MLNFQGPALRRTVDGLSRACTLLACPPAALEAVLAVEAAGSGFDAARRPKALFEPHVFYALLADTPVVRAAAVASGLAYPRWGTAPYPSDSYPRILAAAALDEERALQATSWGLPQLLGRNYAAAGYSSALSLVEAFRTGEDEQLAAMARFIRASGLASALARTDWAAFARGYNGAGYRKTRYDAKLAAAFARLSAAPGRSGEVAAATAPAALNAQIAVAAARRGAVGATVATVAGTAAAATPVLVHHATRGIGLVLAVGLVILCASAALAVYARAAGRRAAAFADSIKGA